MARTELGKRILVAAVGIPTVVVVVYLGRWAIGPILSLFCAGGAVEFYRLAERRGVHALRGPGAVAAAGFVLLVAAYPTVTEAGPILWASAVAFLLVLSVLAIWQRGPQGQPLLAISVTAVGALVPGGAMAFVIFLRHLPVAVPASQPDSWARWAGLALVAYPLAITWVTDSAAFFAGKRWGRRRLIPTVSPGKTVVGGVAGLVGGAVAGVIMEQLVFRGWLGIPLPPGTGALGGLLIGAISQMGDLAVSVWKREAGVKDSGTFFPGHGGILDRMDSLLFTIPAAYWWLVLFLPGSGW